MTTPTQGEHAQTEALRPKFGDLLRNTMASESNPRRDAYFIREVHRSGGGVNPGRWFEMTDGKGETWLSNPQNMVPAATAQPAAPQGGAYAELPKITAEDRLFLHDNPNTDDIVKWVQDYARACIDAERTSHGQAPAGATAPMGERERQDMIDAFRTPLELIALGESTNPAKDATDALVSSGFWDAESVDRAARAHPTTTAQAAPAAGEWDVRGQLAASLTCWHRLTGKEADELVSLFQGMRELAADKTLAYESVLAELVDKITGADSGDILADALAASKALDERAAPAAGAVAVPVKWPTTCDGKEQEAWETWAQAERYDMTQHPLHYLFLNERTYAARQGWKAGLLYAVEQMKAAAPTPAAQADSAPAEAVQRIVHLRADREHRVYVAGPMTGLPEYNFPLFNATAAKLRSEGWHVENPAEHGHVDGAGWADYLRWDISRIATCGAIYLLPGWEKSKGARLEVHIAGVLGLRVLLADGAEAPPVDSVLEDAARWNEVLMHVGAANHLGGQHFTLNTLRIRDQMFLLRGSVAQHFTACIDDSRAARKQGAKHD